MTGSRGLVWSLAWLLAAGWGAASQAQVGPAMVAKQVSASVWYVQGLSESGTPANQNFISNAGFVLTPQGVVVIDALGSPELARRMLQVIRDITPLPVTHLIVTHYHADHIYGLQVFKAAGARILAHRAALDYLASDNARTRLQASRQELAPWIDDRTQLVTADEWLDGPHSLNLGGMQIDIRPLGPAHTAEDLVIHLPQEKVLFAGDLMFQGRLPFVGQADSGKWISALDQLLAFQAQTIVPGHGAVSSAPAQDLELTRSYLLHLRAAMRHAAHHLEPFEAAYQAADWSKFEHLPTFSAINRANAYNTYLLLERTH